MTNSASAAVQSDVPQQFRELGQLNPRGVGHGRSYDIHKTAKSLLDMEVLSSVHPRFWTFFRSSPPIQGPLIPPKGIKFVEALVDVPTERLTYHLWTGNDRAVYVPWLLEILNSRWRARTLAAELDGRKLVVFTRVNGPSVVIEVVYDRKNGHQIELLHGPAPLYPAGTIFLVHG